MQYSLDLVTVQELSKIFNDTDENSIYRYDAIKLIKKWKEEPGLKKEKETDALLEELLVKYGDRYLLK